MRAALAFLLLAGATAAATAAPSTIDDAFPATLSVGAPAHGGAVTHVVVAVRSEPAVTWVAIDVAGLRTGTEVELPIDVPAGAQVVGMTITTGTVPVFAAPRAWERALTGMRDGVDPAMLGWRGASAGEEHLVIRARGASHVELAVALPALATLRVDAGHAPVSASVDGVAVASDARRPTLDLHAVAATPAGYDHVDEQTSLFSDSGEHHGITVTFSNPDASWMGVPDRRFFQTTIRSHIPQLRRCYMAQAQGDPTLAGTVVLHLVIEDDGSISHAEASSELPASVTACVVEQAQLWAFPENTASGRTILTYPLTFKLRS